MEKGRQGSAGNGGASRGWKGELSGEHLDAYFKAPPFGGAFFIWEKYCQEVNID